MYNFDKYIERRGTTSIKYNKQNGFGQPNGLLPFWIADTDFATVPQVVTAIQSRMDHPMIGYSEPLPSCKQAIQGWWERRHGWKVDTDWMLLSYGVVTGIYFALDALIPKGDKVAVFTPVYDPFFAAVKNSGHTLVDCPMIHENNTFRLDFDLLEKEMQNGVKAVVHCNPHNPVGRVWTEAEMQQLVDLCVKYDVYLLSDEIHADMGLYGHKYVTAGRFPQIHNKLVVFTAISKTFNLAGLGSSCMFIPNPQLKKIISDSYDAKWMFGPSDLAFTAMEAAYTYGDQWVDEQCAYLSDNATFLTQFCAEHMPKFQVTKHEGTFLMWVDMRCVGKSSTEMTNILAKEYGLAIGDGSHYGAQADGFMRINIGCTRETLRKGLEGVENFYRKYVG